MKMADNMVIRKATLEDYEQVMDIGKIHHGRDYLPAQYEKYLKWFNCNVGVINGEIVAFNADRLVDGGVTIVNSASRVKEKYQGQGLLSAMLRKVYDRHPDVKYEMMATNNVNLDANEEKIRRKYREVLARGYIEFIGDASDIKFVKNETDSPKVSELTSNDLNEIFLSKELCSRLFPEERLFPNWYPFRPVPENIPLLMDTFKIWATKYTDQNSFSTVSFTTFFALEGILAIKCCVYGSDVRGVHAQVVKQVQDLQLLVEETGARSILFHFTYSLDCVDYEKFLSVFEECGLRDGKFAQNRMLLFDRKLRE